MKRVFLLSVFVCMYAVNANATNDDDFNTWIPQGVTAKYDSFTGVVSIVKAASANTWDCTFNPPTWIAPGKGKNEPFEICFDARYIGEGTGGDKTGHITFMQGRQFANYPGDDAVIADLCRKLGVEVVTAGNKWQIQGMINQLTVEEFTDQDSEEVKAKLGGNNFNTGVCNRNVHFFPTNDWQHFSMKGRLGNHAADSIDLSIEFGKPAGEYQINNFVFRVNGKVLSTYFNKAIVYDDFFFEYEIWGLQDAYIKKLINTSAENVIIPQTIDYLDIPIPVTGIEANAFADCKSLKTITFKSSTPPKVINEPLTEHYLNDAKLYMNVILSYPENAKLYKTMQPWCNFNLEGDTVSGHIIDTIFIEVANARKYCIKTTSANIKMGICLGTGKYENGEEAEVAAISNYGYHFTRWSDGNTDNPRFVNVKSDSTFTAQFEVNNYSVLAAANEKTMGEVEGAATYTYLSCTQLKALPNEGYQFKEWKDGVTANPREILVYSDTVFTAIFEVAGIEPVVTPVNESAANAVNIYTLGNKIVVENATDEIFVYNAMGRLVGKDAECHVRAEITVNTTGVYIVKTSGMVKRVVVN